MNLWELLADDGPLGGVIVDEHESVEADVELLRDAAEVGGLVSPVGDKAGDVFALEDHLWMRGERREGVGLVVLGADSEDDAALGQREGVALKLGVGFAHLAALPEDDAFKSVVADDAGPERVVEIEDESLGGAAAGSGQQACEMFAVEIGRAHV